jgi:polyisoprenoid-binding protein YceI
MKAFLLALAAVLIAAPAPAPAATTYSVDPTNATIGFSIVKWGVIREEGIFRDFTGTIVFDRMKPDESRVTFTVSSRSIDTKNSTRDETLRSADFFHAERYPRLTFRSTKVVPRSNDIAEVTGDLTIRGVTRRITIPVRLLGTRSEPGVGQIAAFETSFEIDRRTFGVLGTRWSGATPGILGNTVSVRIVAGGISR